MDYITYQSVSFCKNSPSGPKELWCESTAERLEWKEVGFISVILKVVESPPSYGT